MCPFAGRPHRSWPKKFADAFRGIADGVRGQRSFIAHFVAAATAVIAGALLRVTLVDWCLLVLCITLVLTAEMLNSAIEFLCRAVTEAYHPMVRSALDVSSGAVLLAAIGAAIVGALIFGNRAGQLAGWW